MNKTIVYLIKCPASPINAPKIIDITNIMGPLLPSLPETIIATGNERAKATMLPFNHHAIPGKLILKMTMATKKYCKKAESKTLPFLLCANIGMTSMMPAANPIPIEIKNDLIFPPLWCYLLLETDSVMWLEVQGSFS